MNVFSVTPFPREECQAGGPLHIPCWKAGRRKHYDFPVPVLWQWYTKAREKVMSQVPAFQRLSYAIFRVTHKNGEIHHHDRVSNVHPFARTENILAFRVNESGEVPVSPLKWYGFFCDVCNSRVGNGRHTDWYFNKTPYFFAHLNYGRSKFARLSAQVDNVMELKMKNINSCIFVLTIKIGT